MCSRYTFVPGAGAWADVRGILGDIADTLIALQAKPRFFPTDPVPIVVQHAGSAPEVVIARWGLIPTWWKRDELPRSTFNARSEEAPGKPMWRDPWRNARCLVPATSWYEWQNAQGKKIPHALSTQDGHGFFFAGMWSQWAPDAKTEPIITCTMLTVAAAPGIAHIHDRMPIVLDPKAWLAWLDPATTDPQAVRAILAESTVDSISAVMVGAE